VTAGRGDGETRRRGDAENLPLPAGEREHARGHVHGGEGQSGTSTHHSSLTTHHSPPTRLRILHIITSLDVGGAQKHLLSLVRGLRERGHAADVAFFKNPSLLGEFEETGATVFDLSARGTLSPLLLPRLARLLAVGRYQIAHTHLLKADAYGALAALLARTPIRISSKHNDEQVLKNPGIAAIHGQLSRLNQRVVVLSDYVGRYMTSVGKVDPNRITRIYYGLPASTTARMGQGLVLRSELGVPPEAPLIGTVGRLTEQKGLVHLLEAMAILRDRLPQARLLVVGDAQDRREGYKRELLRRRDALGLAEVVIFTGVRADVPAIMQAIDLFAMASLWEGFGLVFLEAMAAARPIVATAVSAVPEVVEDGVTGLLVPPANPAAMASAMLSLLSDPEKARRMGESGLLRLKQRFTEERMIESVEGLYFQLWGNH